MAASSEENHSVIDLNDDHGNGLNFQEFGNMAPSDILSDEKLSNAFNDNMLHDDDGDDAANDQEKLLGDTPTGKSSLSFWTFEYYQSFFNVDTNQVLGRIVGSMLPRPHTNFLQMNIRPNADLYGPFWICVTLVFTTAIAGNMANYIQNAGKKDFVWHYDFNKVTFAATAISCYGFVIPSLLYVFLWWRGNAAGYTYLETLCVYGYSLSIYIPISILWVVQYNWFQWVMVIVGTTLSGSVLMLTFWPALNKDSKQMALLAMTIILALHTLLAVGFVLYFFHVPDGTSTASTMASSSTVVTGATTVKERLMHGSNEREIQEELSKIDKYLTSTESIAK